MLEFTDIYQKVVKNANRRKIFNLLKEKKELTKSEISKSLDISITTVSSNIKELLKLGFIEEGGYEKSTGGRKAVKIKYLPNSRYAIGVEIKEDHGNIILVNLDCKIIYKEKLEKIANENLIENLREKIMKFIVEYKIPVKKLIGIGFSLPGTVNREEYILENAPNMGVSKVSFKKLKEYFNLPVYIENEANTAAFAESELIHVQNTPLIYISITEGIGGAIIINNKLYNGVNKRAGEIGHMSIDKDGIECACGNFGCWEQYASEQALKKQYAKKTGEKVDNLEPIFEALNNGDEEANYIIEEYSKYLAAGIKNLLMVFDPDSIIIGGNITRYKNYLIERLQKYIFSKNDFYDIGDVKIEFSKFNENAGILGATLFPINNIF